MRTTKTVITNCSIAAIAGTVLLSAAGAARADVITFGDQKDAMIFGTSGNADTGNSNGEGPGMFAGADGSLNRKRALIQFDIASHVPAGAHITDVKLTMVVGQIAGSGGGGTGSSIPTRTFSLFDLNQPWSEGASGLTPGVGGNPPFTSNNIGGTGQGTTSVVGDSSWDFSSITGVGPTTGTKWNAGGPDLHGGNFAGSASGSLTVSAPFSVTGTGAASVVPGSAYTWDSAAAGSAGLLADVQNWLDNPSTDDGWMVRQISGINSSGVTIDPETTSQSFLGFWTREGAHANSLDASAPMLTVTFDPVPEPAIGALMLLVAPFMLPRRRCSRA